MKPGDVCLYKPSLERKSMFTFIIFLLDKKLDKEWWCGFIDIDNQWRETLIPEKFLKKI